MASAAQTQPGGTESLTPSAVNHILMEFLIYFGRAVVVFYPVYLTGYLGLSISWVLLCMLMFTWWQKNRRWKDVRIDSAIDLVDNEAHIIGSELKKSLQMASWINFTDVEKVQWVNKVLEQAWPFFGMYMEKLLRETIQQKVRMSNSALKMFTFTKIHFGHKPFRITGIRAYTHEVDQREVILDMNIDYDSDVDIDADVNAAIKVGIKGLKFRGMLRVVLEPLISQQPLVGGVTLFFIRRPTLQINWTGMTNLLDSPAFSSLSEEAIIDIIASLLILPNRMCIPLIDQLKVDEMRFPLPRGVVRVHVLEGRNLVAKDTYMMGMVKGKSDPYVTLRVGNRLFKTKTIKENLYPKWNEVYEFVIHEAPGQELEMELYDEDRDKDDFMGRYNLDFGEVKREKEMDQWFPLEGVPHGEIHLKLQWLALSAEPSLLNESNAGLSCAMLAVYLDNASNLPKDQKELTVHQKPGKHSKEARLTKKNVGPNSYVEFTLDKDVQKSKVAYLSKDPVWEQGFNFFVQNVKTQQLTLQVKEQEKKSVLGSLSIPLHRLYTISSMCLDQNFLLDRSGPNSQIKLKVTLRILTEERPPPKIPVSSPSNVKQQNQQAKAGGNSSANATAANATAATATAANATATNATAAKATATNATAANATAAKATATNATAANATAANATAANATAANATAANATAANATAANATAANATAANASAATATAAKATATNATAATATPAATASTTPAAAAAATSVPSNGAPAASPPGLPGVPPDGTNKAASPSPRRNSFLASETSKPSNLNMRRYDSHSLLSENSIASSRFDLTDSAAFPQAIRDHQGSFGEINLTVRYATMRNKLMVLVHSCRNLFPCSDSGTDSYVRIYLLPDVSWRHRKKTHVKKKTVKPVFEEKFEFFVPLEEAQIRQLDVSVKNNKMFRKRERTDIGMLMLDLSQIDLVKGTSDWFELTIPGLSRSMTQSHF